MGQAGSEMRAAAADWASGRYWLLRELPAPDGTELRSAAAVVTTGGEAALPAWVESGKPVVAVDLAVEPDAHLSTVGGARHDQAGFLAGAVAGLATRSAQVALIEDPAAPQVYPTAFLHGLRYVCVRCGLLELQPEEATADRLRAQGVDVVGVVPGSAARDAAEALAGAGLRWVPVDQPEEAFPPGELAARVAFTPGPLVPTALEALLDGQPGRTWPYAVDGDGLQVLDIDPGVLSPGRQQALADILQSLRDGSLDPGAAQAGD